MNIDKIKQFIPISNVVIPPKVNGKYISIMVLSENDTFINTVNNMGFNNSIIKTIFVPTTLPPVKTFLTADYKAELIANKLKPVRGNLKEFDYIKNKHFYIDFNNYYDQAINRFGLKNFKIPKANNMFNSYISYYNRSLNSSLYEKIFIYSVNTNNEFSKLLIERKILPLFYFLFKISKELNVAKFAFDKFILHYTDGDESKFILLYDVNQKLNITKIKKILTNIKYNPELESIESDKTEITEIAAPNEVYKYIKKKQMQFYDNMNTNTKKQQSLNRPHLDSMQKYAKQEKDTINDKLKTINKYDKIVKGAMIGAATIGGISYAASKAREYKWKKNGCDKIIDKTKKQQCLNYLKNKEEKDNG